MAKKDIKIDDKSDTAQSTLDFFLPVATKSKVKTKKSPLGFTLLEVEAWWLECMKMVRSSEMTGSERLNLGFVAYSKNKKFERLITLSSLEAQKEELLGKIGPIFYKNLKLSLEENHIMQDLPSLGMFQSNNDFKDLLITIGVELLANPETSRNRLDFKFFEMLKNPKDRFAYIFLHELGHLYQFKEMASNKNIINNNDDPVNFSYPGIPQGQAELIQKLLSAGIHYGEDNFALPFTVYQDLHHKYSSMAKEMFADCFSVLMYCKLNPEIIDRQNLIDVIIDERRSKTYGAAILEALEYEKDQLHGGSHISAIDGDFSHNTSMAISRLDSIITEHHIDVPSLNMGEIHNLCKECMNYGLINFIYEISLMTPDYKSYLNAFIVDKVQGDIFNPNNKRYTIDNLFDSLTLLDKRKSKNFVASYKEKIKNSNSMRGNTLDITPFVKEAMNRANSEFFGQLGKINKDSPGNNIKVVSSQLSLIDKISTNRAERLGVQLTALDKRNKRVKVVIPKVYKDYK